MTQIIKILSKGNWHEITEENFKKVVEQAHKKLNREEK